MCFVTGESHFSLVVVTNLHLLGDNVTPSCYVFNSLENSHDKTQVLATMKSYLLYGHEQEIFMKKSRAIGNVRKKLINEMRLVDTKLRLSMQPNATDGGVYSLQYAEEIYISLTKVASIREEKYKVVTEDFCSKNLEFGHDLVLVCFVYFIPTLNILPPYFSSQEKFTKMKLRALELQTRDC